VFEGYLVAGSNRELRLVAKVEGRSVQRKKASHSRINTQGSVSDYCNERRTKCHKGYLAA